MIKFAAVFLFSVTCCFSQNYIEDGRMVGGTFRNPSRGQKKPQGSPYVNNMFASANVTNIKAPVWMRYNVVNDEFEYITAKNDTLVMDKIEDFGRVVFAGMNKKYQLTKYTNRKNQLAYGYLIEFYTKSTIVLYKKENISFIPEKVAKTTLEMNMPAKFSRADDSYYFKNKDSAVAEFPDSKKGLIKLYPDKKEQIEKFLKDNKLEFDEESDLIKIVDFLAAL